MARVTPARKAALAVLSERRRRNGRMRDVLRGSEAMAALDERDRALVSRLALGAVAAQGLLDEILGTYIRRPSSVEPRVWDALRIAAFELLYLDTPVSAAVSQGVELVRTASPRAAGMANAVLRRVATSARPRVDAAFSRCRTGDAELADLWMVSGLPRWLLQRTCNDRGHEATRLLALSQLEAAPVYVAPNLAAHTTEETRRLLDEKGLSPQDTALVDGIQLDSPAGLASSGLVEHADVVVADLAAQMVAHFVAPRPGQRVLEVGQGRGTKSILLQNECQRNGGAAQIVGIDSEAYKVRVSRRRMKAAGLADCVTCCEFDARKLAGPHVPPALDASFDLVFVDAPCSGTGTMRRHPEIPWTLAEASLSGAESLPELQLTILHAASSRVREGGTLAYATCSVLQIENEQVVDAFLASKEGVGFSLEGEFFQTMPELGSYDGHFCAKLRRA